MSRTSMTTAALVFAALSTQSYAYRVKRSLDAKDMGAEEGLSERTKIPGSLGEVKATLLDESVANKAPPPSSNGWCLPHQKCTWSDCCSAGTSCNTCPAGYHGERAFGRCAFKGHFVCNSRDCEGEWEDWSECSKTCGGGQQQRKYKHIHGPSHGGEDCKIPAGKPESRSCNTAPCPVDCLGEWSGWGECSATCTHSASTPATKSRTFMITRNSADGGSDCSHAHGEKNLGLCDVKMCPRDCKWSVGEWSECSSSCGAGEQTRSYTITEPQEHGGKCDFQDGQQENRQCSIRECPIPCVGSWSEWSTCEATCGDCTQTRTFTMSTEAKHGGLQCEATDGKQETRKGDLPACCPPGKHFLNFKPYEHCQHETTYEVLDRSCCDE